MFVCDTLAPGKASGSKYLVIRRDLRTAGAMSIAEQVLLASDDLIKQLRLSVNILKNTSELTE